MAYCVSYLKFTLPSRCTSKGISGQVLAVITYFQIACQHHRFFSVRGRVLTRIS